MRIRTAVAAGVTGVLAATGAVVGFQQMAPAAQSEDTTNTAPAAKAPVKPAAQKKERPRVVERFKPCRQGFKLKGSVCVRDVERTVVVDVPGPPTAPTAPAAPPVQPQPVSQPAPPPTTGAGNGDGADGGGEGPGDDQGEYGDGAGEGDEPGDEQDQSDGEDHGEDQPGNNGQDHEDEPENG